MKEKYIEDLKEIKDIMNRSSRFISLSGLSGVSAGIIALFGAYMAYQTVYTNQDYLGYRSAILTSESLTQLLLIAVGTLVLAVTTGIYFTTRETKKRNQKIWDIQTKRLLINLAIPLITGGILCLMLLFKGYVGIVAPLTLVFYGLALVNASKYTLNEIRSLGLIQIVLGLIATHFIGFGLIFWAVGFGVLHIVYGSIMHWRYKS
ncbi:hypothetical protein [Ekhidna sp.]|uniref:hypothetical protein n=1 Tax=Ekhidna sp. TaxID=2608089 RepID=UPI0032EC2508